MSHSCFYSLSSMDDYLRNRALSEEMFSVFIDAYHTELREDGKMQSISIFVSTGIDLKGYKHILGYWVMKGRIAIEGHTDAVPFRGVKITNWELSTERASSARRELEQNGVDLSKIARVVGYADTMSLIQDNPKDPRNRRISIILMFEKGHHPSDTKNTNFIQGKPS